MNFYEVLILGVNIHGIVKYRLCYTEGAEESPYTQCKNQILLVLRGASAVCLYINPLLIGFLLPYICILVPSPTLERWVWLPVYSKLGQHYVSGPRSGPAM